jgi:transcriptional regulator with XRE-family HTH domain
MISGMKEDELKQFGQKVREMREALGYSQEQLAARASLHRNYVGGVERGERNVGLLNLIRLARALDKSPSELLEGIR